ncbi:serine/arginine repetitive matrix protein 5 [Lingula anatina]|uniref:Serine/arginine repetitive matrix protein 5 n=1 Tax=Lingula anatina TaxID=7574 RepID=A0A1S3HDP1_LINAN|nr:serine/arginine repetitive matrix protein 5 [Lingula anatina]|eukprot:XP_013384167.1 serine/arginine repetitive matrix protein 5 [Lingula anatina]
MKTRKKQTPAKKSESSGSQENESSAPLPPAKKFAVPYSESPVLEESLNLTLAERLRNRLSSRLSNVTTNRSRLESAMSDVSHMVPRAESTRLSIAVPTRTATHTTTSRRGTRGQQTGGSESSPDVRTRGRRPTGSNTGKKSQGNTGDNRKNRASAQKESRATSRRISTRSRASQSNDEQSDPDTRGAPETGPMETDTVQSRRQSSSKTNTSRKELQKEEKRQTSHSVKKTSKNASASESEDDSEHNDEEENREKETDRHQPDLRQSLSSGRGESLMETPRGTPSTQSSENLSPPLTDSAKVVQRHRKVSARDKTDKRPVISSSSEDEQDDSQEMARAESEEVSRRPSRSSNSHQVTRSRTADVTEEPPQNVSLEVTRSRTEGVIEEPPQNVPLEVTRSRTAEVTEEPPQDASLEEQGGEDLDQIEKEASEDESDTGSHVSEPPLPDEPVTSEERRSSENTTSKRTDTAPDSEKNHSNLNTPNRTDTSVTTANRSVFSVTRVYQQEPVLSGSVRKDTSAKSAGKKKRERSLVKNQRRSGNVRDEDVEEDKEEQVSSSKKRKLGVGENSDHVKGLERAGRKEDNAVTSVQGRRELETGQQTSTQSVDKRGSGEVATEKEVTEDEKITASEISDSDAPVSTHMKDHDFIRQHVHLLSAPFTLNEAIGILNAAGASTSFNKSRNYKKNVVVQTGFNKLNRHLNENAQKKFHRFAQRQVLYKLDQLRSKSASKISLTNAKYFGIKDVDNLPAELEIDSRGNFEGASLSERYSGTRNEVLALKRKLAKKKALLNDKKVLCSVLQQASRLASLSDEAIIKTELSRTNFLAGQILRQLSQKEKDDDSNPSGSQEKTQTRKLVPLPHEEIINKLFE